MSDFGSTHLDATLAATTEVTAAETGSDCTTIVLTRDRELLKRRGITHGCYVRELRNELQLREIFDRLDLAGSAQPFTRCLSCNGALHEVAKAQLETQVPTNAQDDDLTLGVPALEKLVHALQPLRHRFAFSSKATAYAGRDSHQSPRTYD